MIYAKAAFKITLAALEVACWVLVGHTLAQHDDRSVILFWTFAGVGLKALQSDFN